MAQRGASGQQGGGGGGGGGVGQADQPVPEPLRARAAQDGAASAGVPFEIPGATGGTFRIEVLNQDTARGVVTSIVHLPPGGRIPAHRHGAGAEMHFVLSGDLIERGEALGPGAFLTHAAGVVHGPHKSRGGARVLTVQQWQSREGDFDFEIVEDQAAQGGGGGATGARQAPMAAEGVPVLGADDAGEDQATAEERRQAEQSLGKGYG
jgi:quercetin dioxygenase-like cupin family protein